MRIYRKVAITLAMRRGFSLDRCLEAQLSTFVGDRIRKAVMPARSGSTVPYDRRRDGA
jgi:hypothetical protein